MFNYDVTYNGNQIRNPVARMAAGVLVAASLFLVIVGLALLPVVVLMGVFLSVPVHCILRLFGRRGFYVREGDRYVWTSVGATRKIYDGSGRDRDNRNRVS